MADDYNARAIFDIMVRIVVGRGDNVLFWRDKWIRGLGVSDIAPRLMETVPTRIINSRTDHEAPTEDRWYEDCDVTASFTAQLQCSACTFATRLLRCTEM